MEMADGRACTQSFLVCTEINPLPFLHRSFCLSFFFLFSFFSFLFSFWFGQPGRLVRVAGRWLTVAFVVFVVVHFVTEAEVLLALGFMLEVRRSNFVFVTFHCYALWRQVDVFLKKLSACLAPPPPRPPPPLASSSSFLVFHCVLAREDEDFAALAAAGRRREAAELGDGAAALALSPGCRCGVTYRLSSSSSSSSSSSI